eukprot:COSAG01_NODE_1453_length_10258_cov_38.080126_1_plen_72_part_00
MGKGLPGGRRQAGRIDYRTEPCRSVAPPGRSTIYGARPPRAARCARAELAEHRARGWGAPTLLRPPLEMVR